MLVNAIAKGTGIFLAQGELWLGMGVFAALMAGCLLLVRAARAKGIVAAMMQALLVAVLVTAVFIILLGGQDVVGLSFLDGDGLWMVIKAVLLPISVTAVLCFVPVIGPWMGRMPGVVLFIQAALTARVLAHRVLHDVIGSLGPGADVWPGFWLNTVFVAVSIAAVAGLTGLLLRTRGTDRWWSTALLSCVVGVVVGMWLLCVYCSCITLAIERATGM